MVTSVTNHKNPFVITKAEGFNHSYDQLASLMQFKPGVADVLLSNTNVFIEGSRGSGKSMYLRLLSLPVKTAYDRLAEQGLVVSLPGHEAFIGVYAKLTPTIFGPHEYQERPGFRESFQQLFNIYCIENMVSTLLEIQGSELWNEIRDNRSELVATIANLVLPSSISADNLSSLFAQIREQRRSARQVLNTLTLTSDMRSQPDILWQMAELVQTVPAFSGRRVHLLIDEYDSLSPTQQRILNGYLRKRDFPLAFKIACKKHCLVLDDSSNRPLNPSGDFDRVELDDDDFGISGQYSSYAAAIANKRLKNAGYKTTIEKLLAGPPKTPKHKAAIQYGGLKTITMLSSGIVRTFLELCRDVFARCQIDEDGEPLDAPTAIQDEVVKQHASNKWSALSRDQSARAELQHLIEQIASLFKLKAASSKEKQIIRLEIIDFDRTSSFLRQLLTQALEYEALVQPNRERLQKNRQAASRGYLLHRLLCVHFRLEPTSRWDAEITSDQLETLVLGDYETAKAVAKHPTLKRMQPDRGSGQLFNVGSCPILDEACPRRTPNAGVGFLSCRLPETGHIRDAIRLLKESFTNAKSTSRRFELRTAQDYPSQGDIACKVCHAFAQSEFVLAEMSKLSPSVAMELGLAIARKIPTYMLFNSDEQPSVPEPFSSLEYFPYPITASGVEHLVETKILPQLSSESGPRRIQLGPEIIPSPSQCKGVFVALPGDSYHQETILPELKKRLESVGIGPVITEQEGQALNDLQRAATNIANAKYCLIDTTHGAPTRAMYLGMAQGYYKPFANLIDLEFDPEKRVFTNAKSKSEIDYRDSGDLFAKLKTFFLRYGVIL